MEKETIFLTVQDAIKAILRDFRQYDPQLILFSSITPLITKGRVHLKREPGKKGMWISRFKKPAMKWMSGQELVQYMCDLITHADWDMELLAGVCSRVFQTHATPETDEKTGSSGIRLLTNMESFNCCQCGCCCRFLEYRNEVTAEDVARWKTLGREDILEWVEEIRHDKQGVSFRAWVTPRTREAVDVCPFLQEVSEKGRWRCRIHDARPGFCRQFPFSRKHALMSGCRGFQKGQFS